MTPELSAALSAIHNVPTFPEVDNEPLRRALLALYDALEKQELRLQALEAKG